MFIQKNRPRTTVGEPIGETLAKLPFTGDQAVCLGHDQAAWSDLPFTGDRVDDPRVGRNAVHPAMLSVFAES